jgi:hypothetical protein
VPATNVVLYRELDGSCPFLEWFGELPAKVQDKCYVVSHGAVKERIVPPKEIDRAVERKKKFEANPARHTYQEA